MSRPPHDSLALFAPTDYLPIVAEGDRCCVCFAEISELNSAVFCNQCKHFPMCSSCRDFYYACLLADVRYDFNSDRLRCPLCRGCPLCFSTPLMLPVSTEKWTREVISERMFYVHVQIPQKKVSTKMLCVFITTEFHPAPKDVYLAVLMLLDQPELLIAFIFFLLGSCFTLPELVESLTAACYFETHPTLSPTVKRMLHGEIDPVDVYYSVAHLVPPEVAGALFNRRLLEVDVDRLPGPVLSFALSGLKHLPKDHSPLEYWRRMLSSDGGLLDISYFVHNLLKIPLPGGLAAQREIIQKLLTRCSVSTKKFDLYEKLLSHLLSLNTFPFDQQNPDHGCTVYAKRVLWKYFGDHTARYEKELSSDQFQHVLSSGIDKKRLLIPTSNAALLLRAVDPAKDEYLPLQLLNVLVAALHSYEDRLASFRTCLDAIEASTVKFGPDSAFNPQTSEIFHLIGSFPVETQYSLISQFARICEPSTFVRMTKRFQDSAFCSVPDFITRPLFVQTNSLTVLFMALQMTPFREQAFTTVWNLVSESKDQDFGGLIGRLSNCHGEFFIGDLPEEFYTEPHGLINCLEHGMLFNFSEVGVNALFRYEFVFSHLPLPIQEFVRSALLVYYDSCSPKIFSEIRSVFLQFLDHEALVRFVIRHFKDIEFDDEVQLQHLYAERLRLFIASGLLSHTEIISLLPSAHPMEVAAVMPFLLAQGFRIDELLTPDRLASVIDTLPDQFLLSLLERVRDPIFRDLYMSPLSLSTTLLHIAARRDAFDWVVFLIESGADFFVCDSAGKRAVDVAIGKSLDYLRDLDVSIQSHVEVPPPPSSELPSSVFSPKLNPLCYVSPSLDPISHNDGEDLDGSYFSDDLDDYLDIDI